MNYKLFTNDELKQMYKIMSNAMQRCINDNEQYDAIGQQQTDVLNVLTLRFRNDLNDAMQYVGTHENIVTTSIKQLKTMLNDLKRAEKIMYAELQKHDIETDENKHIKIANYGIDIGILIEQIECAFDEIKFIDKSE